MTDQTVPSQPEPVHPAWELAALVTDLERDADRCAAELAKRLRSLADDLVRNAERLESNPHDEVLNSCGVIQSTGYIIDAEVLRLATLRRSAAYARSAVSHNAAELQSSQS